MEYSLCSAFALLEQPLLHEVDDVVVIAVLQLRVGGPRVVADRRIRPYPELPTQLLESITVHLPGLDVVPQRQSDVFEDRGKLLARTTP